MASSKFKKLFRKYKRYTPVLLFIGIPFFIGLAISFKVKKEIKLINRGLHLAGIQGGLVIDSNFPGYFSTNYDLTAALTMIDETRVSFPFKFKISNLPSIHYIAKGQIRFGFEISIPYIPLKKEVRGQDLKIEIEKVMIEGGYVLPSGMDAEGTIGAIKEKSIHLAMLDTKLDLTSRQGEWLSTAKSTGVKLNALGNDMVLNDFKITINGDNNRETNDYGFTMGFSIQVPSQTDTDLKFNFGGTIHNIPHDLDVIEREGLKAYADSGSSFDVSASLSIGKPAFRSIAKGSALKEGVEVEGAVDINIPEAYRNDKIIAPIVAYLNANSEEFKTTYGVDLNQMKVNVPFNVKQKKFLVNGKPFFICDPPIRGVTRKFKIEELRSESVEKVKFNAIEDILSEEVPNRLAESYCRLNYALEFGKPDPSLSALMILLKTRSKFDMKMDIDGKRSSGFILSAFKSKLANEEELLILAEELHCYLDVQGLPCVNKLGQDDIHPFRKLLSLTELETIEPLMVAGLTPPEGKPSYIVHAYDLLKTKVLNGYYTRTRMAKELTENINANSTKFSRNFMVYEIMDYYCNFLKESDCLKGIEKYDPGFHNPRFTKMYIDLKVKLLRDLRAKNMGPNCQGFIAETVTKIPASLQNANFQLLMQECPGGYVPSATTSP